MQSVALRLVADREEEINAFIPEEYWTLDVILKIKGKSALLQQVLRNRSEKNDDQIRAGIK